MTRDPRLAIITRALKTSGLADLEGTAHNVYIALYGRPVEPTSPLAQAEDAKRRRDLVGEIGSLMGGHRSLTSAPWYPGQSGDIVHVSYDALPPHVPAYGETYIVEEPDEAGWFGLRLLAHSRLAEMGEAGDFATEGTDDPLFDVWFEAGPHTLTIIRHGRVVHHGGGA